MGCFPKWFGGFYKVSGGISTEFLMDKARRPVELADIGHIARVALALAPFDQVFHRQVSFGAIGIRAAAQPTCRRIERADAQFV